MACAIVAKKAWIKVAHVEGGIRSGDLNMPEEINRMVTDSISDYFFTTTQQAGENLQKEGHDNGKIFFVGNTMIDSLILVFLKKLPIGNTLGSFFKVTSAVPILGLFFSMVANFQIKKG